MKPGTVSMLRIGNFNSLFYYTHTLISIMFFILLSLIFDNICTCIKSVIVLVLLYTCDW